MIYKTDYHIHTLFSDGKASPQDYIEAGIKERLSEIGFSEHLNLLVPGQKWCMDKERTPEYVSEIRRLSKPEKRIAVRTGLEVDYFPGYENEIFNFLKDFEFDYLIGSVHYMGDTTVDSGPEFYEGKDIDQIYRSYFDTVISAVESGLFDIIGHCDLVRIYNFKPSFDPEFLYTRLASAFARHDVTFEVNTNGRNRKLADFYPDRRFLEIFRSFNVPVCVNSDAHFPERVGQFFDEAYSLLKIAGYTEMASFIKRERYMVPFNI